MKIKLLLFSLLFAILNGNTQTQAENYVDGPMVGAVTDSITTVNFILGKGNQSNIFHVALRNVTQNILVQTNEVKELCVGDSCLFSAVFRNLTPNNDYRAILYKNNVALDSTRTDFTVPDNIVNDFSFLTGSCAYQYASTHTKFVREDIFEQMSSETSSDFMLWLGDQIYLPYNNLDRQLMFDTYMYYKTESPKRRNFMKQAFHFGIWDDHDYSYDNGTKDFFGKLHSTELYKSFWPNSGYKFQNAEEGIYGTYKYEDAEFFMTDSRYYKSRYEYLGRQQLDWLKEALLNSTATFKFITLGSITVVPQIRNGSETYIYQTGEREELFDFIYANNITGVIFLSGDIHRSYFGQYQPDCNSTYPIYEYTCSPLTSNAGNGHYNYADLFIEINQTHNYGKIDITGAVGNRVCTIKSKDVNGNVLYTLTINENELKPSTQPDLDPTNVLSAQYDFANNTQDASPNAYHATANGVTPTFDRKGNNNNAYLFTTYPNTIDFPNSVLNNKNNFTASFWMKPTVNGCGVLSVASSTVGNEVLVYYNSAKKITVAVKNQYLTSSLDTVRLNEWTHIALTRNGTTGEVKLFINGQIQSRGILPTGNIEAVAMLVGNDQDGAGGGNLDPNQQFKGILDEVYFYEDALCGLQIEDLYNKGLEEITPLTNDTICEAGTVTFVTTGTTQGNYKWYKTREGNSLINHTDSSYTTPITETTTFWVSADNFWKESKRKPVTITVADKIYSDIDSLTYPSNLFAWFKMDGNAEEVTGNTPNATVNGAVLTTGRFGNANSAYQFTNYQDLINIPNQTIDGAEEITLSFWIKTSSSSDGIVSAASSTGGNELLIYLLSDGTLQVIMNERARQYTPIVNDNQWHHVVFTASCKEGQGNLYVDGEIAVTSNGYFNPGELEVPNGAFIIGNDQDTPGGGGLSTGQQYVGSFDDLKIYRRQLTTQEVTDIYNDNVKYKTPFVFDWNALKLCEGETYNMNFTTKQNNITYYLANTANQIIDTAVISNDSVFFNTVVNTNETFYIIAKNSFGCEKQFDSTFAIESVNTPTPSIVVNGNDLCTDITADNYVWLLNGNQIATQSCITLTNDGDYQVYAINNPNCISDTSSVYSFYTNIKEVEKGKIKIYPNVTSANLTIESNINTPNTTYQILNLEGKIITKGKLEGAKTNINVNGLERGIYLIKIGEQTIRFEKI